MNILQPFVSVIIPTYYDWDRLQLCVNGLRLQSYDSSLLEIIVVNNAPGDCNKLFASPDNAIIIDEEKPGSYAARNAALKIAKGEVIAFLDSDCIPDPKWIEEGVKMLAENDSADRLAGKVELFFSGDKLTAAECFEKGFAFRQEVNVEKGVSVTANLFVYRRLFEEVDFFDNSLISGGDFEWNRRATAAGYSISYCSSAIVKHPARSSLPELLKKASRVSVGSMAINKKRDLLSWVLQVMNVAVKEALSLFHRRDMTLREKILAILVWKYIKFFKLWKRVEVTVGLNKR